MATATTSPAPAPPPSLLSPNPDPNPPTSSPKQPTSNPSTPLPRNRSVQFSTPDQHHQMSRSVSPTTRIQSQHQQQQAENYSSADEITPIVGKERRGNTKNKSYDTTTTRAAAAALDNGVGASRRSSASSNARRRKGTSNPAAATNGANVEERHGRGREVLWWWKDLVDKYGSVELDNKGSVARDHLALERTFLAWLRTSLAFASIGIAITQLFRLNTTISEREGLQPSPNPDGNYHLRQVGKPLGATFLGIAILVLLAGGRRYFESQYWIIRGKFPASRGTVFLITSVALILIIASLVIVSVVDPSVFEKK